jgi:NAD(P)H-hydrate epimerase
MEQVNEHDLKYRSGDAGVKYFFRGPRIDWGVLRLKPGDALGHHYHERIEETFYFPVGGPLMIVNGENLRVRAGDAIRLEPGDTHEIVNDTAAVVDCIFIKSGCDPEDKVNVKMRPEDGREGGAKGRPAPEPQALTVARMREADRRAIEEFGVPGVVLMENAGRGAAGVALGMLSADRMRSVLILAGRGNNGGDGFVIARHLANAGMEVRARLLARFEEVTGDARTNLEVIRRMKLDLREMRLPEGRDSLAGELSAGTLVVDAMLGTGAREEMRDPFRTAIELVNASGRPVLAVDVPSGLDGAAGRPLGACIVATQTATFAAVKIGMLSDAARCFVGKLTVIDIGMPRAVLDALRERV